MCNSITVVSSGSLAFSKDINSITVYIHITLTTHPEQEQTDKKYAWQSARKHKRTCNDRLIIKGTIWAAEGIVRCI